MVDPIQLATATSALTVLGHECLKGIASEATKEVWRKVKELFDWTSEPKQAELAQGIATKLNDDPALMSELIKLLQTHTGAGDTISFAGSLVANLKAKNAVVSTHVNVINMGRNE
jgi:hypothetical protein